MQQLHQLLKCQKWGTNILCVPLTLKWGAWVPPSPTPLTSHVAGAGNHFTEQVKDPELDMEAAVRLLHLQVFELGLWPMLTLDHTTLTVIRSS